MALPLAGGLLVALLVWRVMVLPGRYAMAVVAGISLVSLSMLFLRRFADYLLVALLFSVSTASLVKYVAGHSYMEEQGIVVIYSGAVGVGIPDFLLGGLYLLWFVRIFVTRQASLPRMLRFDLFVLGLLAAHVASVPGTFDTRLSLYAIVYLVRYALLYFYVSRHLARRHVPWIIAAAFFAIAVQVPLGGYQTATGKLVGLAMDRGTGKAMNAQYEVPGIEERSRATGTTYDSHAYGTYLAMLAPFAFVAAFLRPMDRRLRMLAGPMLVLAVIGVLISFSRSAWGCCAAALALVWAVHLKWGERRVVPAAMLFLVVLLILSPWALDIVIDRMDKTIIEHLNARFEQFHVAWNVWKNHFFFGVGAGNYMEALQEYNEYGTLELPVHNVFLWVAAETGLFGVTVFFGMVAAAFVGLWRTARRCTGPSSRLALAALAALAAYLIDGLTDPLFREPVIYMMFWLLIAMMPALRRMQEKEIAAPGGAASRLAAPSQEPEA